MQQQEHDDDGKSRHAGAQQHVIYAWRVAVCIRSYVIHAYFVSMCGPSMYVVHVKPSIRKRLYMFAAFAYVFGSSACDFMCVCIIGII